MEVVPVEGREKWEVIFTLKETQKAKESTKYMETARQVEILGYPGTLMNSDDVSCTSHQWFSLPCLTYINIE